MNDMAISQAKYSFNWRANLEYFQMKKIEDKLSHTGNAIRLQQPDNKTMFNSYTMLHTGVLLGPDSREK